MMCFNKKFTHDTLGLDSDDCFFVTLRYRTCDLIHQRTRKVFGYPTTPIDFGGEFYTKLYYHPNPHFIDN